MLRFLRTVLCACSFWALGGGVALAQAEGVALVEGQNYRVLNPPQPTDAQGKIEVIEVFSYACPHCHAFEPYLAQWLARKPEDIAFARMPAVFRESWVLPAKAYYTAEALGVLEKFHPAMFHAVHVQRRPLPSEDALAELFAELGVAAQDFHNAFRSFGVDSALRRAMARVRAYGVPGVPAFVVAGRYQTSGGMVQSYEELLKVLDALVDKVREEAAAGQAGDRSP